MTDVIYRPICREAPCEGSVPLAGGGIHFTHVEPMAPGERHAPLPVSEVPTEHLDRLTAPRAAICGVEMSAAVLMGVLNVTPDSFSDGGHFNDAPQAIQQAQKLLRDGAHFLDIGGESTRPGAREVDPSEEAARTAPVIARLRDAGVGAPISIDTRKASVARAALEAGAQLVNDVSTMTFDPEMAGIVAAADAPICLMHAQGSPETMQLDPSYGDVVHEVYGALAARLEAAEAAGIARERIILDPGIGFGKTADHNLTLIRNLSVFHGLGCPVLLGVSRKRFIGAITAVQEPAERVIGSVTVALEGLRQGVQILRVHDIEAHRQALSMWHAMRAGAT